MFPSMTRGSQTSAFVQVSLQRKKKKSKKKNTHKAAHNYPLLLRTVQKQSKDISLLLLHPEWIKRWAAMDEDVLLKRTVM